MLTRWLDHRSSVDADFLVGCHAAAIDGRAVEEGHTDVHRVVGSQAKMQHLVILSEISVVTSRFAQAEQILAELASINMTPWPPVRPRSVGPLVPAD